MGKKAWEAARITVRSWVLQELLLCSGDVVPALQKPASPRMSSGRTLIALNDPICLLTVEQALPVGAFSHLFVPRGGGLWHREPRWHHQRLHGNSWVPSLSAARCVAQEPPASGTEVALNGQIVSRKKLIPRGVCVLGGA